MTSAPIGPFVALLRAVNVGGTGRLLMPELKAMCETIGLQAVRTYVASGNVVFESELDPQQIRVALEGRLRAHAGRAVPVALRTAAEMRAIVAANPFADAPADRVLAIFLDQPTSARTLDGVRGLGPDEEIALGRSEIFVRYGRGMARSKLRIPAAAEATARNMNTVTHLAAMAAATANMRGGISPCR